MNRKTTTIIISIISLGASFSSSYGFEVLSQQSASEIFGMRDDACAFYCLVPNGGGDCTEPFTPGGSTFQECPPGPSSSPCGPHSFNAPCGTGVVGHTFLRLDHRKKNDSCKESTSLYTKCETESAGYCVKTKEMICYDKTIAPLGPLAESCIACSSKPSGNSTVLGTRWEAKAPVDYCN